MDVDREQNESQNRTGGRAPWPLRLVLAGVWAVVCGLFWLLFGPAWTHEGEQVVWALCGGIPFLLLLWRPTRFSPRLRGPFVAFFILLSGISLVDLAARTVLNHPVVLERNPAMPEYYRLTPGKDATFLKYQDLARMSGDPASFPQVEVHYVTDRFGFRNAPPASEGPLDLVLLGDSFGEGQLVTQESAWGSLFQSTYGRRTYNLSTIGAPWQEMLILQQESPRLDLGPGAVVVWALFNGNDLDDYCGEALTLRRRNLEQRTRERIDTLRRKSPVRNLAGLNAAPADLSDRVVSVSSAGRDILFYDKYLTSVARTAAEVEDHENSPRIAAVFGEMGRMAEAGGWRVVVVLIPAKEEIYPWLLPAAALPAPVQQGEVSGFANMVASLSGREDFPFLDLKPAFFAEARRLWDERGELLWHEADTHWNEAGHRLAARKTHEFLRTLDPSEQAAPDPAP